MEIEVLIKKYPLIYAKNNRYDFLKIKNNLIFTKSYRVFLVNINGYLCLSYIEVYCLFFNVFFSFNLFDFVCFDFKFFLTALHICLISSSVFCSE